MSPSSRALTLFLITAISICLNAEESALEPYDGVLVLRNGFVLQGRITPIQDVYLVTMGSSGEVRLPKSEVEFHCRDLNEAYLQQRDALKTDEPAEHLRLAEWCLRHGLLSRASDQLLLVSVQDPGNSRLKVLEQRLDLLARAKSPVTAPKNSSEPVAAAMATAPTKLSPQLMQQFSMVVQPILLNRCATHACHGNGSKSRFKLIRPALGHTATSRMTQRNLQAALAFIDNDHPENSAVLAQGSVAHGASKSAPFTDKQRSQLDLLESWVRRAATTPVSSIAADSGGPEHAREASEPASPAVVPATFEAPVTKRTTSNKAPVPPKAKPLEAPAGKDPFDPQIFNNRYHPQEQ